VVDSGVQVEEALVDSVAAVILAAAARVAVGKSGTGVSPVKITRRMRVPPRRLTG